MADDKQEALSPENVLIFAPLGVVFTLKDMAPQVVRMLSKRGHDEVGKLQNTVNNTYVLAKSMGQLRVNQAQQEGKKHVEKVRQAAEGGLKLVQGAGSKAQESAVGAAKAAQGAATSAGKQAQSVIGSGVGAATKASGNGAAKGVANLAIPDYDTLSALNIADRLDGLTPDQLGDIRGYETANKARKTILGKIDSLLGS